MLRARTAAAGLAVAAALACGAAPRPAERSHEAGPVVLSESAGLRRLTPRGEEGEAVADGRARAVPSTGSALSALAVVVLLIFGAAKLWKTHGPKPPAAAPREAIEVLGRCRIESRQAVYLVRVGSRVLVLGSSGGELSTLSEVTDAVEVDLIAGQCRDGAGRSSPFTRLFEARRKAEEPTDDPAPATSDERPPARWFQSSAEQRLADRVRGRGQAEEASRVA